MSVTRINEFRAAEGKVDELRSFLRSVVATVVRLPGCRGCQLLTADDDAGLFLVVEIWDDVAAHQAAARAIPPEQLATVRPLLREPPKGRYLQPLETQV